MQKTRDSGKCTKVTRNRDARTQFRRTSTHFLEDTTLCGMLSRLWRNGRVVEGGSLENCCAARYRGFKSYFLRQNFQARSLNGLFHSMHRETSGSQPFASSCPLAGRRAFHDPLSDPATQLTNQRKRFPWQSRRAFHDPAKDARQLPPAAQRGQRRQRFYSRRNAPAV